MLIRFVSLLLSIGVIALLAAGAVNIYRKNRKEGNGKIAVLLYLFVLLLAGHLFINPGLNGFSLLERIFQSIIQTLQSFSMDADYKDFVEETSAWFTSGNSAFRMILGNVFGTVMSALYVAAPIMGGAILLEILTEMFPRLKLYLMPFRGKFVFSCLNEASITLAEDLYREDHYKIIFSSGTVRLKPLIVFANTHADSDPEQYSELSRRANALHAVCIREDIQSMSFRQADFAYYFLIHEDEKKNISSILQILDLYKDYKSAKGKESRGENAKGSGAAVELLWPNSDRFEAGNDRKIGRVLQRLWVWFQNTFLAQGLKPDAAFYVFCQSELGESTIIDCCRKADPHDELLVRPLRDYSNAALILLNDVPLFQPLLDREQKKPDLSEDRLYPEPVNELHVAVIGSGFIAQEIFGDVFSIGQMCGYQLYIHVLSLTPEDMELALESRSPQLLESCKPSSPLLEIFQKEGQAVLAPRYAVVTGLDTKINALNLREYPEEILEKTDYYIIALGDDQKAMEVTSHLKTELTKRAIRKGVSRHPVIAPAIFNDDLAFAAAHTPGGKLAHYEPWVCPFATMRQRFSCRNVFMRDFSERAKAGSALYDQKVHSEHMGYTYRYRQNMMKALHAPYKLFAMGRIRGIRKEDGAAMRYIGSGAKLNSAEEKAFAWMEHRRWNACTRFLGFSGMEDEIGRYFALTGNYRNEDLKLHGCLTECSMQKNLPHDRLPDMEERGSGYDHLDEVSWKVYRLRCDRDHTIMNPQDFMAMEFKQYDGINDDPEARNLLEQMGNDGGDVKMPDARA